MPYELFLANEPVDDNEYKPLVLDREGEKHIGSFNLLEQREKGLEEIAKVGKKRAGRQIDGREWNQFPEVNDEL